MSTEASGSGASAETGGSGVSSETNGSGVSTETSGSGASAETGESGGISVSGVSEGKSGSGVSVASAGTGGSGASAGTGASGVTAGTGTPDHAEEGSQSLVATMSQLLKAHTEAIAAQTQAATAQHLPPLKPYTGEGKQIEEDGVDRWLEQFEERAKIFGWSAVQQLHQLKMLLEKTALRVFRMLPDADHSSYAKATAVLRSRFKSVDIEELRGLEFHHKVQGDESIEELRMQLQALGRKAFPSSQGREFDRLLKGRFFQALHVKWQRKLGAPKTGESFQELYDRARVLEQHERQYMESAASRSDGTKKNDRFQRHRDTSSFQAKSSRSTEEPKGGSVIPPPRLPSDRVCYRCRRPGHISRNCPERGKLPEAPGRSLPNHAALARNAALESRVTGSAMVFPEELSAHQLEELLVRRRLQDEQKLFLDGSVSTNAVSACGKEDLKAVGPTVYMSVQVSGVPVEAMVDTGTQSTIISRSLLHEIGCHMKRTGQPLPCLERPTARLFGKDGEGGGCELVITAQVPVTVEADGESTWIPVFVQPDSKQQCLLGMNALPALGLTMLRANGEPLIVKQESNPGVAHVRLVEAVTVPSLKGCLMKVKADCGCPGLRAVSGSPLLFEPRHHALEPLGLGSHESLVTVLDDGCMLVPVHNYQGTSAFLEAGMEVGSARCMEVGCALGGCDMSEVGGALSVGEVSEVGRTLSAGGVREVGYREVEVTQCAHVDAIVCSPERSRRLLESLELPSEKLRGGQSQQLTELLTDYSDAFALCDSELGCTDLVKHSIDTGDHRAIRQQPYRVPIVYREKIDQMVAEMKEQGIVRPSMSPWASPVVLVPKKDGKLRFSRLSTPQYPDQERCVPTPQDR